jgi:hypothetical protein
MVDSYFHYIKHMVFRTLDLNLNVSCQLKKSRITENHVENYLKKFY